MSQTQQETEYKVKDFKNLEQLINTAMKKVGARKENDLCHYLPGEKGGYIHHFSMRKMKNEAPEELATMISKYIVNPNSPEKGRLVQEHPAGRVKEEIISHCQNKISIGSFTLRVKMATKKSFASSHQEKILKRLKES